MTRSERFAWGVAAASAGLFLVLTWPIPQAWTEEASHPRLLDRNGTVLFEQRIPTRGRTQWAGVEEVSPAVVDALLASEDRRFWWHPGVDPIGIARAAWANLRAGRVVQGGSTLTQQLARSVAPRPPGLWGKVVEATRAVRLEVWMSKTQILEQYLNRASFGQGAYGIETAAQEMFDEDASTLSISESAMLVGLLTAPERMHPRRDFQRAIQARDQVLKDMVDAELLAPEVADLAQQEPLQLRPPERPGLAPHLGIRLLGDSSVGDVQTTLDADLQRDVQEILTAQIAALEDKGVTQGAVLVVHWPTSEVRAWVGSADWTQNSGQFDGVQTPRSPGSTLKPFAYGLAFDGEGLRPGDVLSDLPGTWDTPKGKWTPGNYSGKFHGPVRARVALASSLNLPAVRLADEVGVTNLHQILTRAGVGLTAGPRTYGLGLVLGDSEVTLASVVEAYAGLARGGLRVPLQVQPQPPTSSDRFMSPKAAWWVRDILSDRGAQSIGFGDANIFRRGYPLAVKTGTSTGFRDNWTVGWAGEWVVGVWVGNFDGKPMGRVTGITGAAPTWARVLDRAIRARDVGFVSPPAWETPPDWVREDVCALSGANATERCPLTEVEFRPKRLDVRPPCDWHRTEGLVWPSEFAGWAHDHGANPYADPAMVGGGSLQIQVPVDGAELYFDPRTPSGLPLRAQVPVGTQEVIWRVDGTEVARVGPPFSSRWDSPVPGPHTISVEAEGRPQASVNVQIR